MNWPDDDGCYTLAWLVIGLIIGGLVMFAVWLSRYAIYDF